MLFDPAQYIGVDTETIGKDGPAYCISMATLRREKGRLVDDWCKCWFGTVDPFSLEVRWNKYELEEIKLLGEGRIWGGHNFGLFDYTKLKNLGLDHPEYFDTLPASHVYDSEEPHGAKYLAYKYLEIPDDDEEEIIALTRKARSLVLAAKRHVRKEINSELVRQSGFDPVWLSEIAISQGKDSKKISKDDMWLPSVLEMGDCSRYAKLDAQRHIWLWAFYHQALTKRNDWLHYKRRLSIHPAIRSMSRGIMLCPATVNSKVKEYTHLCEKKKEWARSQGYNLDSPRQVAEYLFTELSCPVLKRGSSHPSTDKEVLVELSTLVAGRAKQHVKNLLDYRKATKALAYLTGPSGYLTRSQDYCLAFRLNPTGTSTTRASSSNPNGQNIPKKDEKDPDKPDLRACFVPRPGFYFASIDYSQIELLIFAWATQEKSLQQKLLAGEDVHQWTGDLLVTTAGMSQYRGSRAARRLGKTANYLIIYGGGAEKLGRVAKTVLEFPGSAHELGRIALEAHQTAFPGAGEWSKRIMQASRKHGFIRTAYGYPLVAPWRPKARPYASVDHYVQGTAGDVLNLAIEKVHNYIHDLPIHLLLQVHDQLLLEVDSDADSRHVERVKEIMEDNELDGLVTPVDVSVCHRHWGEA